MSKCYKVQILTKNLKNRKMISLEDLLNIEKKYKNLTLSNLKKNNYREIINENGNGSYFIQPTNKNIKKIIFNFNDETIKSIFVYADFDFNFNFLCSFFGDYREVYSPYDNLYFYYFNENNDFNFYLCFRTVCQQKNNFKNEVIEDSLEIIYKR